GAKVEIRAIPDDMKEMAELWHHEMVEKAVELDDSLMETFLEDEKKITIDQIRAAIRKGTIERKCYPVFVGSALKYIGVQLLLDGVIDSLPTPPEVPPLEGIDPDDKTKHLTRPHSEDAPFSALVFKVVSDSHGDLTYIRIYSGKLDKGSRVLNPGNGKKENV